jgi:hypothetical protein
MADLPIVFDEVLQSHIGISVDGRGEQKMFVLAEMQRQVSLSASEHESPRASHDDHLAIIDNICATQYARQLRR